MTEAKATESNRIIFRPMRPDDIERVHELEVLCFRTPWSKAALAGEFKNTAAQYIVCERAGHVIAYAGMWVLFDEAHITNVAVDATERRAGIGRRLMRCLMRHALLFNATSMTLEVRESNFAAQALYASMGFEKAGVRKGYYGDTGEDAFVLWNKDVREYLGSMQ